MRYPGTKFRETESKMVMLVGRGRGEWGVVYKFIFHHSKDGQMIFQSGKSFYILTKTYKCFDFSTSLLLAFIFQDRNILNVLDYKKLIDVVWGSTL